jgi:membrane fusion protein (multidrug efflux system)
VVTANQETPLTTIQQLDPIYVDVTQSSSELLQLRRALESGKARGSAEGTPVTILLEDGGRYAHQGKLTFADVAVDPSTGRFALRAVVPNPDQWLMPGMYVRAELANVTLPEALLVPQQGVMRDPKGNATAMVVAEDGTARRRDIQVSRTVGDKWLVAGGLNPGDRVIVAGLQKIQDGTPVEPTEADAAAAQQAN